MGLFTQHIDPTPAMWIRIRKTAGNLMWQMAVYSAYSNFFSCLFLSTAKMIIVWTLLRNLRSVRFFTSVIYII
jgi:hypothetical protein